nr:biotin transporter BioY [bacterium]
TLQTLFVLSSGMLLGPGYGIVSMAAYAAMGAAGLPVFTGAASGIGIWSGVTAGYLAGFVLFAGISGWAFRQVRFRGLRPQLQCGLFYLGDIAFILIPGTVVLKIVVGTGWATAAALGFYPFLFGDLLKVIAAYTGTRFLERRFPVGDD